MKKIILIFISLFVFTQLNAQLLNEVGIFGGGTNYSGDIGNELFIFPNRVGGGIIYKRNYNSRIAYRASYSYIPIHADDKQSFNKVKNERGFVFTNLIEEIAFGIEFNYFNYDVLSKTEGHTPYVFVEIAGFYYNTIASFDENTYQKTFIKSFSYSVPFGIGYKAKITDHLGFSTELKASYTVVDDLDYNSKTNRSILKMGDPNTKDWYFITGFSLTYSFGRPPCFVTRH